LATVVSLLTVLGVLLGGVSACGLDAFGAAACLLVGFELFLVSTTFTFALATVALVTVALVATLPVVFTVAVTDFATVFGAAFEPAALLVALPALVLAAGFLTAAVFLTASVLAVAVFVTTGDFALLAVLLGCVFFTEAFVAAVFMPAAFMAAAFAAGALAAGFFATAAFAVLLAWDFPGAFLAGNLAVGLFLVLAAIVQSSMLCRGKPKQNRARTLAEAGCFAKRVFSQK
jgi:hypothetical protein